MIKIILATLGCIIFSACKKDIPNNTVIRTNAIVAQPEKIITLKTGKWNVYPHFGGPGEDSMFFSWSPAFDFKPEQITNVSIKTISGKLLSAPLFINVSQRDSGYLYQSGNQLGSPDKIAVWWIQKQPLTVPDADSVFITLKL